MSGVSQTIGQSTHWWIRNNIEIVARLPEPGETWEINDVECLNSSLITKMRLQNVIESRGWIDDKRRDAHNWETNEDAWEFAQHFIEHSSFTPCGHTGIRCIESGELYECTFDDCDETFGREVAEEVLA